MSQFGDSFDIGTFYTDHFTGDGTTTTFRLTYPPASPDGIEVSVASVIQDPGHYAIDIYNIIFNPAPAFGTAIWVKHQGIRLGIGVPGTGTVGTPQLVPGAVTADILAADAVPHATNSIPGLVKLATVASILAGSDNTVAITPAGLLSAAPFNYSSTSGYTKFANGLILQWGITNPISAGTSLPIIFPISFPTVCYGIIATLSTDTTNVNAQGANAYVNNVSRGTISNFGAGISTPAFWMALGS